MANIKESMSFAQIKFKEIVEEEWERSYWYSILTKGVDPAKLTAAAKEDLARQLWTRIVNNSLDTGSKAFAKGYYPWVRSPDASIYVKAAILRAGEYFGDVGKHKLAGDLFREYTILYKPDDITKLKPVGGFCAETAGAITLFAATAAGIPVSTTHTITGAIVGVGATKGYRAVRWGLAGRIIWAWIFTIPASALVAAGIYLLVRAVLNLSS
jgi:hypothetical protein